MFNSDTVITQKISSANSNADKGSNKYIYFEALRILACFLVIFNHSDGFILFSKVPLGSKLFWVYLAQSVFCTVAVPVFFAISGALLLGHDEEPLKDIFTKRISKKLITLTFFSFVSYCIIIRTNNSPFILVDFFLGTLSCGWNYSYWYLYSYIALLLSLPFLRVIAKSLDSRHYQYIFLIYCFFYCLLPVVRCIFWQNDLVFLGDFKVGWISADIFIFPLMGYYMHHRIPEENIHGKTITLLWLINVLCIILSCYLTYYMGRYKQEYDGYFSTTFVSTFSAINLLTLFLSSKYFFARFGDKLSKMLSTFIYRFAAYTFGIYLCHLFILEQTPLFMKIPVFLRENVGIGAMTSEIFYCIFVMAVSFAVTWVIKKIPGLRSLV